MFKIHDFWNRDIYHEVLNFLEIIESSETLNVFKVKACLDLNSIFDRYSISKFDPR